MYTDDNSNNDKDGEEKKNIPLMSFQQEVWLIIFIIQSDPFFFQFIFRYLNIKLQLHCLTCSWQFHHQMKDDCRRENEIVMSKITFETTKKFIRFRGRLVLMHFIRCIHFKIYLWLFLSSLWSLGMRFIRRCLHDYNSRTTFNLLSISCL